MNRAAQVAGGVYVELLDNFDKQMIYHFGVMIGQSLARDELFCGPEEMREHVRGFERNIRPEKMQKILKALDLLEGGMHWIEALERCSGYYDEKTGRPWRDINAEEEALSVSRPHREAGK